MVQFKKDEIKEKIDAAALAVFAVRGYREAKITEIAARAGVSVGNIYRYYKGKDEIFAAILPETFWPAAQELIFAKIGAFGAGRAEASRREFIEFMVASRERLLILFNGSQGTQYEHVKTELARFLVQAVREHYPAQWKALGDSERLVLRIYEGLVDIYAYALQEAGTAAELERLIAAIDAYHLLGISGLLGINHNF